MAVGEALSGFYARIEDGFFKILDALETRGIPVYNYVEFLEKRGVPVFPFTLGAAIIILLALWFFLLAQPSSVYLTVRFQDDSLNAVNAVSLAITGPDGRLLWSDSTDSSQRIMLERTGIGDVIKLKAEKEGYESAEQNLKIAKEESEIRLELAKITELINARIRLEDSETGNLIKDAEVTAEFDGKKVQAILNDDGTWTIIGVPKGADIKLTVKADGYEDSTQNIGFDSENASTFSLAPKTAGPEDYSNIHFKVLDRQTGELVNEATVKVMEAETGRELSSDLTIQGEVLVQLQKGKSVKWTVAKEGYAAFDSTANGGSPLTLRKDEENIEVRLEKGGASVQITVVDKEGSNVQAEALVTLFNESMEKIDQNITGSSGSIEFKDLNVENKYFASAFKEGFLPSGIRFSPRDSPTLRIELGRTLASSTANVAVFVVDASDNPVENASLSFAKITQNGLVPLGMPEAFTNVSGYYGANFEAGIVLSVKAVKDEAKGDSNSLLESASLNRIEVQVFAPSEIVEFYFQDSEGYPVNEGSALIRSGSGTVLYDGNISNARLSFDTRGNKTVKLRFETPEGDVFEQSVTIEGKPTQTITLGSTENNGLSPGMEFAGLENANGESVEGIPRGQEGFLVFSTSWPESPNSKGGIHVRVGSDAVKNAESQDIAVLGFNAEAASSFFGRTYNPSPKPGNESVDFSNKAEAGKAAKFLELYLDNPSGSKTVKVRVKASENASLTQEFHYRAWSVIDGRYYRSPADSELADSQYSREKLGLYAETLSGTFNVFEAGKTACYKKLCASFKFLDSGLNSFEAKDFKAVKGEVYALEIALSGKDYEGIMLKASTSREAPRIGFQGSDVDSFGDFIDLNSSETSIEVQNIIVSPETETIARIYFKALSAGSSSISLQIIDSNAPSTHNFQFNIFEEKQITASFIPALGEVGKRFSIMLSAAEDKSPVENAVIVFKNPAGNEAFRIVGNGTQGNGRGGSYSSKNTLKAGNYAVEITAQGYRPLNTSYTITRSGVLAMPESIEVRIPSVEKTRIAEIPVRNNSNSEVSDMSVEAVKPKGFDNAFSVDVSEIPAMAPNSASAITLTASYNGSAEKASTSLEVKVYGMLAENVPAVSSTKVHLSYNQKLDSSCLEINPAALQATLYYNPYDSSQMPYASQYYNTGYGSSNTTYNPYYNGTAFSNYYPNVSQSPYYYGSGSSKQLQLVLKNNCEEDLSLTSKVLSQNQGSGVSVSAPELELAKGEEKTVSVDVENLMPRSFYTSQAFNYGIRFEAEQLSKEIPLTVRLLSIRLALQAPDSLEIYVTSGKESNVPMFVRNVGTSAIENLTFQTGSGYTEGVSIRVMPERTYVALPAGQAVFPPAVVAARADIEKSKTVRQIIDIKGAIDGKEYTLKTVNVFVRASAESCLKVSPESVELSEEAIGEGTKLSEKITITNQCLEEVRISDIDPKNIGANDISIAGVSGSTIAPSSKTTLQLRLVKKDEIDTTVPLVFYGAMARSGKRIQTDPINLSVKLGRAAAGPEGVTSVTAQVQSCEDSTKTKTIKFPKIANGKDCGSGYCDAEQLSDFIADRISKKVSEVESAILAKNKEPEGVCVENPRYCTFSELDARPETFTVYFQNDNLTAEIMRSKLENDAYSIIKGFQVNYFITSPDASILQTVAGKGYGRQILIPAIKGCGKYRIKIDGAVDVIASQIQRGRESVGVFLLEKTPTAECDAKIQNFQNFLPEDKSLSYESSHLTWLGTVDSALGLEDSAKEIASGMFKKPDRFVQGSTSSRLYLDKKSIPQGIVEITIPFSEPPQNPATVNAFIRQEALTNEKQKKETLQEAARAIASLKSSAPAKGSCITEDEKTLRITSAEESFGQVSISSCVQVSKNPEKANENEDSDANKNAPSPGKAAENRLSVFANAESCCSFSVSGNLANQRVAVRIEDLFDRETEKFAGIEWSKTYIKNPKTGEASGESGELLANLQATTVKQGNASVKKNSAEFLLCTRADPQTFAQVHGRELTLKAVDKSMLSAEQNPVTNSVKIEACAIHPYDLVEKLAGQSTEGKNEKAFYFIPSWKGAPEIVKIGDIVKAMEQNEELRKKLGGKHFEDSVTGQNSLDYASGRVAVAKEQLKPIGAYIGACVVGSGGADLLIGALTGGAGFLPAVGNAVFNCALPAGSAFADVYKKTLNGDEEAAERLLVESFGSINEWLAKPLKEFAGIEESEDISENAFNTGMAEQLIRGLGVFKKVANIPGIKQFLRYGLGTAEKPSIFGRISQTAFKAAGGILANKLGQWAYNYVRDNQDLSEGAVNIKCDSGNDGWNCELLKNQAFKANVKKKGSGEEWSFSKISEPKEIPSNAEWIQECAGKFSEKGLVQVSEINPRGFDPKTIEKDKNPERRRIKELIASKARDYGIPEQIALGLADKESSFRQSAVSDKGAIGIMQVTPKTAAGICGIGEQELKDEEQNIDCGLKILADYYRQFSGGIPESEEFKGCKFEEKGWNAALRAYNGRACRSGYFDAGFVTAVNNRARLYTAS